MNSLISLYGSEAGLSSIILLRVFGSFIVLFGIETETEARPKHINNTMCDEKALLFHTMQKARLQSSFNNFPCTTYIIPITTVPSCCSTSGSAAIGNSLVRISVLA